MTELKTLCLSETPEGGIVRLALWSEGFVLFYHGAIVWRSWEKNVPQLGGKPEDLRNVLCAVIEKFGVDGAQAITEYAIQHRGINAFSGKAVTSEADPSAWMRLPSDLWSHRRDFLKACEIAKSHSWGDDKDYWQKQIETLEKIESLLSGESEVLS